MRQRSGLARLRRAQRRPTVSLLGPILAVFLFGPGLLSADRPAGADQPEMANPALTPDAEQNNPEVNAAAVSPRSDGAPQVNQQPTSGGSPSLPATSPLALHPDYPTAYRAARDQKRLLVVFFASESQLSHAEQGLRDALRDFTDRCDAVIIPPGSTVRTKQGLTVLREDPAFSGLEGQPGVALISFLGGPDDPDFGRVIRTLPLPSDTWSEEQRAALARELALHLAKPLPAASDSVATKSPGMAQATSPDKEAGPATESDPPATARPSATPAVDLATFLAPIRDSDMWLTSYEQGVAQAKREKKMLLVYLYPERNEKLRKSFEESTLRDEGVLKELANYVRVRLPESAQVEVDGQQVPLLSQPMLSEMEGQPGLFIIDYASEGEKFYGEVVSQFPFLDGRAYTSQQMLAILTLPPGTLTQRTMVYAVRTHPERPRSVLGRPDRYLFSEAEKHSEYQARIRVQGHHFWETRFARIIRALRGGRTASEVCAESWPGQGLLRAALECVRSWRLSSGHWRAVSSQHEAYGYDIKRGANGVWYATGIFVQR